MEKARQLSILCGSSVAIFIVSSTGKLYSFSSGDSMARILSHCETQHADEPWKLEEAKSDSVNIDSLFSLEEQLKTALSVTRARKTELIMEFVNSLQEKEKLLREENQVRASQIGKMKKFLETEDERAMSPGYSSGNNSPETLSLLK